MIDVNGMHNLLSCKITWGTWSTLMPEFSLAYDNITWKEAICILWENGRHTYIHIQLDWWYEFRYTRLSLIYIFYIHEVIESWCAVAENVRRTVFRAEVDKTTDIMNCKNVVRAEAYMHMSEALGNKWNQWNTDERKRQACRLRRHCEINRYTVPGWTGFLYVWTREGCHGGGCMSRKRGKTSKF